MQPRRNATADWYRRYQAQKPANHNSVLNPQALWQSLAIDGAVLSALRHVPLSPGASKVLDVGCSRGGSLERFLRLGMRPSNLYGVDILPGRIQLGRTLYPGINFEVCDAAELPFDDEAFDLTMASTMFVQLTDEAVASTIARQMMRVTKVGGHLLVADWRYGKPGNRDYVGFSTKRMRRLFGVGGDTALVSSHRGALVPPVGRRLSAVGPGAYFAVRAVLPFLTGLRVVVLRKERAPAA